MSLSTAISGGIVMITLVFIIVAFPGIIDNTFEIQEASSESTDLETTIQNTGILLSNPSATEGSNTITFALNNTGFEKLWNYEKFVVMITYDSVGEGKLTESLSLIDNCADLDDGNWCYTSITNDILDPAMLNSGEMMNIQAQVSEDLDVSAAYTILVSTHNGITTSISREL